MEMISLTSKSFSWPWIYPTVNQVKYLQSVPKRSRYFYLEHPVDTLRNHIGGMPEKCDSCKFETFCPVRLKRHNSFCTKRESNRDLHCRYCKKPVPFRLGHLRRHELTHSDVPNYLCDKCNFKTKTPQGLKNRSLYHEDPKYFCDKCDYKSFNSANLSTHKNTKHGNAEHKCDNDPFNVH